MQALRRSEASEARLPDEPAADRADANPAAGAHFSAGARAEEVALAEEAHLLVAEGHQGLERTTGRRRLVRRRRSC